MPLYKEGQFVDNTTAIPQGHSSNGRTAVSKTVSVGSIPATPAMAIVAKWLTHRIVAPTYVGSIPISRPNMRV